MRRSSSNTTQPPHVSPPVPTDHRPAWDIVIEHTERRRNESAYGKTGVIDLVLADMRERDKIGRERYGVPLAASNGRNHLIDAYQEALDLAAYLAVHLDEHGVGVYSMPIRLTPPTGSDR